ncbi:FadR/GntR family transcriptional regulator [Alkaliflexus imshenetskii]|uniref:FadR/GntR family transcriptional regulator n=1 Tax=Alkaliflexus imshenetskii TaxID=286730 RepID=UPI00047AFED3|nr:FCD domain-containing protein [Alkaliflexus imshenetskii]
MKTDEIKNALTAIDTRSLVDKAEMNLIRLFIDQNLKAGDLIPKEMELAEAMGVSRTVIRESLNRLKTMGLIESIKHKGTIITSPDMSIVLQKMMIPAILDSNTLRNVFEMRLIIEVGMADFVVARATDKDIEDLRHIVSNEISPSRDTFFDVNYEVEFHSRLYAITGNETLKGFQQLLLPVFSYVYTSGLMNTNASDRTYVSHKELVEILAQRDADKFRDAMRNHLENHFGRVLKP